MKMAGKLPQSCEEWDALLCVHDDPGELIDAERQAVDNHLNACAHCRESLAEWRETDAWLKRTFPRPRKTTEADVPDEVVERNWKVICEKINQHEGRQLLPLQPVKRREPKREYALWASWACGIAAAVLFAIAIAAFCSSLQDSRRQPTESEASKVAPAAKTVTQLRAEFDRLVARNDSRQISVSDFENGVRSVIAECRALLAKEDLPEPNAIHAQKLMADAYGALAEYQKEFTAYLAFAERLSRYYTAHPDEFDGDVKEAGIIAYRQTKVKINLCNDATVSFGVDILPLQRDI